MQPHHSHEHHHYHTHHDHDVHHHSATRLKWAFVLTTLFMVVEVVGGIVSGSLALIADAGHMFTDSASLGLAIYAIKVSTRPPDAHRSYGYGRTQVLAAFVNGVSLLALSAWIAIEAFQRLRHPATVDAVPMLVISSLGFAVNLIAFFILHGGEKEDLNLQGAIAHILGDLFGSAASIVAALVIWKTGWFPIDPLLSVLVALLIVKAGYTVTKKSAHILLQGAAQPIDSNQLEAQLRQAVPGVLGVHHVHLWSISPSEQVMTLHTQIDDNANADAVITAIAQYLKTEKKIAHVTVQVERQPCQASAV
jgi:cobalt-zinc-cadmium efflux system protein